MDNLKNYSDLWLNNENDLYNEDDLLVWNYWDEELRLISTKVKSEDWFKMWFAHVPKDLMNNLLWIVDQSEHPNISTIEEWEILNTFIPFIERAKVRWISVDKEKIVSIVLPSEKLK